MKFILGMIAAGLLGLATQTAIAADGAALMQKGGCVACHGVDKKILGPAFKDVAAKYKGQKDAEDTLVKKVKAGGSGVWGPMPMPANTGKLSDDEFKSVVGWILSL
jgi:cytochrome c